MWIDHSPPRNEEGWDRWWSSDERDRGARSRPRSRDLRSPRWDLALPVELTVDPGLRLAEQLGHDRHPAAPHDDPDDHDRQDDEQGPHATSVRRCSYPVTASGTATSTAQTSSAMPVDWSTGMSAGPTAPDITVRTPREAGTRKPSPSKIGRASCRESVAG